MRENYLTKRTIKNNGTLPKYHATETHEAIISLDDYNKVQVEMKRRAELHNKTQTKKHYPFSGLITCGCCGKHYRRKTTATGAVWICTTFNSLGKKFCSSKQIPETTLTELSHRYEPFNGKITAIIAKADNVLNISFSNGTSLFVQWSDRSRANSWTDEMRAKAREKYNARSKHDA